MCLRSLHYIRFSAALFIVIGITIPDAFGSGVKGNRLPDTLYNEVSDPDIHTVTLSNVDWEFTAPVIEAGTGHQLELRFDDLSGKSRSFGYTLVHCDAGWVRSNLIENEYLSGYGYGSIRDVNPSFNTSYSYTNYRLVFPEEDCKPVISGNYAIVVYDESNPDIVILTRRFYVAERAMQIEASVKQPAYGLQRQTGQQVSFSVSYNSGEVRDPQNDITAVVIQNNRYDRAVVMKKPWSVRPGRIEFTDPDGGIIDGGNEFRSLDIKSIRYQTENVAAIEFRNPYYHFVMKPDKIRANRPYFSRTDLNGSYYIDRERTDDRHTEADYVYVHFKLELPPLYSDHKLYVAGNLTGWKHDSRNLMKFNPGNGLFELTLLLKQGLYDYCFFMENPDNGLTDEYEIEGSYYETENDYFIFVYYHDRFNRYDRLTGYLPIK